MARRNKKKITKFWKGAGMPPSIVVALAEMKTFPGLQIVAKPIQDCGEWCVTTTFAVELPSRAIKAGISSTGVRDCETVYFRFPANYPRKAPRVFLRKDFPRNLPHINPGSINDFVPPCIYDGSLDDLLHQGLGLTQILQQMQDWLRKAASNSLINLSQGWEAIRYDTVTSLIVYEHAKLRGLVVDQAGSAFLTVDAFESPNIGLYAKIHDYKPRKLDGRYVFDATEHEVKKDGYAFATRPLLFCWPDKDTVVSSYFPETVTNWGELVAKSKDYGTHAKFWEHIQMLWNRMGDKKTSVEVFVIHCVRRPLPLINQGTNLELLGYRVRVRFGMFQKPQDDSPVDIVCHIHAVGPELLRSMSGASPGKMDSIVQVGCGSLGSKIALHLCRAGHGPFTLIDDKHMSEHNLARHALTSSSGNKAELLQKEMVRFGVDAVAHKKSLQGYLARDEDRLFDKNNLVIDSTASISVREILGSLPMPKNDSRVFQTGLYSEGKLGYITIEGAGRNPRVDDLHAAFFDLAIDDKPLSNILMESTEGFRRHSTGQGCGSFTMVMPDTKLSQYSAAIAERARQAYEGNIPADGEILLGAMQASGMSLAWNSKSLLPTHIVMLNNKLWELRVLAPAFEAMAAEAQKHPTVETGGILIGRLSLARKCAIVTRILEAPPDTIRTMGRFELGTEGLREKVENIAKSSGLTYLGTWHSHLYGDAPSEIDEATLRRIKELRLGIPAFNLIWHNRNLTCFADYGDY